MHVEEATIEELKAALGRGEVTASALTAAYLARIAAYDPILNAVREANPEAPRIAAALDAGKCENRRPLEGIPILLKDNIATANRQQTTAGSLALASAGAKRDATLLGLLKRAGAVILGKTNLTEFANILALDMPAGYSSLAGQVRNPYRPLLDEKGLPLASPGGSSSGSAVAVAASFAAAAIGTETSGSLLSPAKENGIVTVKPTVGLISRAGIIPIAKSQDTAGPMTRTVRDAAILLNVLAARDPLDPATLSQKRPEDYTRFLDKDGLKGARIGVPSDPSDPANDAYYGRLPPSEARVMGEAIAAIEDLGAAVLRANLPTRGWIGGPGTEMAILNTNPLSARRYRKERLSLVLVYELKEGLDAYLRDWAEGSEMKSLADIIAFNERNPQKALHFGQDVFLAAGRTRGDLSEIEYASARAMDLKSAREEGLDAYLDRYRLDAVLFPGAGGAAIAAKAGYPSVEVPAGFVEDADGTALPFGVTFTGRAWSEPSLLSFAYAFEEATKARRPPSGFPPLDRSGR
jgi:amidase